MSYCINNFLSRVTSQYCLLFANHAQLQRWRHRLWFHHIPWKSIWTTTKSLIPTAHFHCCILYDITLVVVLEFTPLFSEKYTYLWLSLWSQKRIITTTLEPHMHGNNTKPDTLLGFLFKKKNEKGSSSVSFTLKVSLYFWPTCITNPVSHLVNVLPGSPETLLLDKHPKGDMCLCKN